ncbi:MAG: ParB/RepB/Spo0J family partition protein, partial [Clostridiales bacterium]|nr:ParB/RepB/Spo0J family partition protein [Clostridiales bacterium]
MLSIKGLHNNIRQRGRYRQVLENIPIALIKPNPYQPRKGFSQQGLEELSSSIKEIGLIHPITVRKTGSKGYELIAGERRLRAVKMAGMETISAIIVSGDEKGSAIMAMIENLQREDLHYLEEARGYSALIRDHGLTQEELAVKIGKSQSTIANKIRLLRLSDELKEKLVEHSLTERHARCLLRLPDDELRMKILNRIINKDLNVKDSEGLVEKVLQKIQLDGLESGKGKIIGGYRDLRIFINTIKNAVVMTKDYGIAPLLKEVDMGDSIEITVTIPKSR